MPHIQELLSTIALQSSTGNHRELTKSLRTLCQNRKLFYQQSITEMLQEGFADALYKSLLLELDEEEEDSIEMAELAYLSLSSIIQNGEATVRHYKQRILLLHYFCDFFTDSIIHIFLERFQTTERLQARRLAIECIEKMQLADLFYLEESDATFIDQNEELVDACNGIETDPHLSPEEKTQAEQLHHILYAYLKVKYKKRE